MSIKANELRINNYFIRELRNQRGLEYDHDFKLTETEMGKLFGNNIGLALQDLSPIPLTPEILLACGFTKRFPDKESNIYDENIISIAHIQEGKRKGFIIMNCPPCLPLDYLHQLQNLYFAISQTELNYTP